MLLFAWVVSAAQAQGDAVDQALVKALDGRATRLANVPHAWKATEVGRVQADSPETRLPTEVRSDHMFKVPEDFDYRWSGEIRIWPMAYGLLALVGYAGINTMERRADSLQRVVLAGPGVYAAGTYRTLRETTTQEENTLIESMVAVRVTSKSPGDSLTQRNPVASYWDFNPQSTLFLAGTSPLKLYGTSPKRILRQGSRIVIEYHEPNPPFDAMEKGMTLRSPWAARIEFTAEGVPLKMTSGTDFDKRTGSVTKVGQVIETKSVRRINGLDVPAKVEAKVFYPKGFFLRQKSTVYERIASDDQPPSLKNIPMIDWRLLGSDMTSNEFPPPGQPRRYSWNDRFPTLKELQGLPEVQFATQEEHNLLPTALQVTVGSLSLIAVVVGGVMIARAR
jgi:hypothetical protein